MKPNKDKKKEDKNQPCNQPCSSWWHLWNNYSALVLLTLLMVTPVFGIYCVFVGANAGIPLPPNPDENTFVLTQQTPYNVMMAIGIVIWCVACIWMARSIIFAAENDVNCDPVWIHFVNTLRQLNPFTKPKENTNAAEESEDDDQASGSSDSDGSKKEN